VDNFSLLSTNLSTIYFVIYS